MTKTIIQSLKEKVLSGEEITKAEAITLYNTPEKNCKTGRI